MVTSCSAIFVIYKRKMFVKLNTGVKYKNFFGCCLQYRGKISILFEHAELI